MTSIQEITVTLYNKASFVNITVLTNINNEQFIYYSIY